MLASSSKRAFSSTMAATCLPFSAARMSDGHDRAVAAGAVERLLDPEHRRVLGRLGDEGLDRGGERVVGVVDQHVALAQHGEELGRLVGRRGQAAAASSGVQVSPCRSGRSRA